MGIEVSSLVQAGQLARGRRCRALMLRKAMTYLPAEQRERVMRGA